MKKTMILILIVFTVSIANAQREVRITCYDYRFEVKEGVYHFVEIYRVKTVSDFILGPGLDSGYVKERSFGEDAGQFEDGKKLIRTWDLIKLLKKVPVHKSSNFFEDGKFEPKYKKAYLNPNKEVLIGTDDCNLFSNYFLTKKPFTRKSYVKYVTIPGQPNHDRFDLYCIDTFQASQAPWVRLIIFFCVLVIICRLFSEGLYEIIKAAKNKKIAKWVAILFVCLVANVVLGAGFLLLFGFHYDVSFGARVLIWFIRYFIILITGFLFYWQNLRQEKKEFEITPDDKDSLDIDETAGSESLDQ